MFSILCFRYEHNRIFVAVLILRKFAIKDQAGGRTMWANFKFWPLNCARFSAKVFLTERKLKEFGPWWESWGEIIVFICSEMVLNENAFLTWIRFARCPREGRGRIATMTRQGQGPAFSLRGGKGSGRLFFLQISLFERRRSEHCSMKPCEKIFIQNSKPRPVIF